MMGRKDTSMKQYVAAGLSCLALVALLLSGCGLGSYNELPGKENDSASETVGDGGTTDTAPIGGDENDPDAETPYTVALFCNNLPFDPEEDPDGDPVEVIWHGSSGIYSATVDANGEASAGVLDGEFDVYLSGLPEKYSYNPNLYRADGENRRVEIDLVTLTEPDSGDGGINASGGNGVYTSNGCYKVSKQGTYRVTCQKKGQYFYFEYKPTAAGYYVVESWSNVYDDMVNPLLEVYSGNVGAKYFQERLDGGGAALDGGYTKNFRYEIALTSVGNTYTFGVSAESKTGEYPVTVDFAITYVGPIESESTTTVVVKAEKANKLTKPSGNTFVYADRGTTNFDETHYAFDESVGVYRVFDEETYASTDGWGPYLCVQIANRVPSYSVTSLYDASSVGSPPDNQLQLSVVTDDGTVKYDYTDFIRVSYYAKCNADGVCYVTQEMKEFLDLFARLVNGGRGLWTDDFSPMQGSPQDLGYSASANGMWLFACGYYED